MAKKLASDRGYGILVIPHWEQHSWFIQAHDMSIKKFRINGRRERIFEDAQGNVLPPPGWDVWALLINAAEAHKVQSWDPSHKEWKPKTNSAHRRNLRKKKRQFDAAKGHSQQPEVKKEELSE